MSVRPFFAINAGSVDRTFRIVLGLALLTLAVVGPQTPWGYLGLVPLATGLFGFCPFYAVMGISTCPAGRR
jgi:hypothetical protein